MRLFLFFALFFFEERAFSFPEMIRHSYPACAACHVSPTGGGALTAYGRSNAGQLMSIFDYEDASEPLYGLMRLPQWISLGGDVRYIDAKQKAETYVYERKFLMQKDVELALHLSDAITIGGSYGFYAESDEPEYRRSYLKLGVTESIGIRLGRFIPAYGIQFPDHTIATRETLGLGQDGESYNAEFSLSGKRGEVFLTAITGSEHAVFSADKRKGYDVATDDYSGAAVSASVFIGSRARVGLSGLSLRSADHTRTAYGLYTLLGLTKRLYLLGEYDAFFQDGLMTPVFAGRLGWEIITGAHLILFSDGAGETVSYGMQVQLFPLAHWELSAQQSISDTPEGPVTSTILMLHSYL